MPEISPSQNSLPFLSCKAVTKSYPLGSQHVRVLQGVTLRIQKGESLAIMGASGAGKSTLLHVLGGLDTPDTGSVSIEGKDVYALSRGRRSVLRADRLGFVFQSYHLLPELSILENVMLPHLAVSRKLRNRATLRDRARVLLEEVGLGHRITHRPMELSGGEQQRAALARSLINEPDILLADEPTGNLDSRTGQTVLDSLYRLTRDLGRTLVMVTHNEAVANECGRVIHLIDGRLDA